MSLMGYEEVDVIKMREAIERANNFILRYPSDTMDKSWLEELNKASEFFECLIIEGRV